VLVMAARRRARPIRVLLTVGVVLLAGGCGRGGGEREQGKQPGEPTRAGNMSAQELERAVAAAPEAGWWREQNPCGPGRELITHIREDDPAAERARAVANARRSGVLGAFADRDAGSSPAAVAGGDGAEEHDSEAARVGADEPAPFDPLLVRTSAFFRRHPPRESEPFERWRPAPALEAWSAWCVREDGLREGPWAALYDDHSTWITGWYHLDQRHGRYRALSPTGKVLGEFSMRNGSGEWTTWDETGHVRHRGAYEAGAMHGTWQTWHTNGQLATRAVFEHGEPTGTFTIWNEDGKKMVEGGYVQGKRDGRWVEWDRDGQVLREIVFEQGTPRPSEP